MKSHADIVVFALIKCAFNLVAETKHRKRQFVLQVWNRLEYKNVFALCRLKAYIVFRPTFVVQKLNHPQ